MSRKRKIIEHYDRLVHADRPGFEIADWASADAQHARFEVLVAHVDLAGKTLLDVGCGVGDLWAHLKACNLAVDYTGVDLSEAVIETATARYPGATFRQADVFCDDVFDPESFDAIYVSGVFNFALGNNEAFLATALPRLIQLARETVTFNFLDTRATHREPYCHYYDPSVVQELLSDLSATFELFDDYLPHDTTAVCRKR